MIPSAGARIRGDVRILSCEHGLASSVCSGAVAGSMLTDCFAYLRLCPTCSCSRGERASRRYIQPLYAAIRCGTAFRTPAFVCAPRVSRRGRRTGEPLSFCRIRRMFSPSGNSRTISNPGDGWDEWIGDGYRRKFSADFSRTLLREGMGLLYGNKIRI